MKESRAQLIGIPAGQHLLHTSYTSCICDQMDHFSASDSMPSVTSHQSQYHTLPFLFPFALPLFTQNIPPHTASFPFPLCISSPSISFLRTSALNARNAFPTRSLVSGSLVIVLRAEEAPVKNPISPPRNIPVIEKKV